MCLHKMTGCRYKKENVWWLGHWFHVFENPLGVAWISAPILVSLKTELKEQKRNWNMNCQQVEHAPFIKVLPPHSA